VGRGGIVAEAEKHAQALRNVARRAQSEQGYMVIAACASPITGAMGNREFFLHLRRTGQPLPDADLEAMISDAVRTT
jgi:23S rRNA (cytidine1920-2'-O)/16S rRNA (cytidine1409-2'-O)-methyltransferase